MASDSKVIDAEFVEDKPSPKDNAVHVAVSTARTVASSLDKVGLHVAANKAREVAEVAESAQQAYRAMKPGVDALSRLMKKMEETGMIRHASRPPLGKKAT